MNTLRKLYNDFRAFFTDDEGNMSMTRLTTFVNVVAAAYVTLKGIQLGMDSKLSWEYVSFVFTVWVLAYLNKNVGRYIERLNKFK